MSLKLTKFDAADFLKSEAHIQAYLVAALEENDPAYFQQAEFATILRVVNALGYRLTLTPVTTVGRGRRQGR